MENLLLFYEQPEAILAHIRSSTADFVTSDKFAAMAEPEREHWLLNQRLLMDYFDRKRCEHCKFQQLFKASN